MCTASCHSVVAPDVPAGARPPAIVFPAPIALCPPHFGGAVALCKVGSRCICEVQALYKQKEALPSTLALSQVKLSELLTKTNQCQNGNNPAELVLFGIRFDGGKSTK